MAFTVNIQGNTVPDFGAAVSYGPVILSVVKVHKLVREPVYNGRDYVWTRNLLSVRGVLNTTATPFNLPGNPRMPFAPNVQAVPLPGQYTATLPTTANGTDNAVTADQAIRQILWTPRQQLEYRVGYGRVLFSPLPGFQADANYGPYPRDVQIVTWIGPRTALIDFTVETFTNEALLYQNFSQNNPLVSLQWEAEEEIDEHFYSQITTRGRAVFRADVLESRNFLPRSPDFLRKQLFLPIPNNFKRDRIWVKLLNDNVTLEFVVIDKQRALNWSRQNVTRVEAIQSSTLSYGGIGGAFGGAMGGALGQTPQGLEAGAIAGGSSPSHTFDIAGIAAGIGALSGWASAAPMLVNELDIKVWGSRQAFRRDLHQMAIDIYTARVALLTAPSFGGNITFLHDLTGTFVEMRAKLVTGPALTIFNTGGFNTGFGFIAFPPNPASDDTGQILVASANQQIPPPPHDSGSRGTGLVALVTQALSSPLQVPVSPSAYPAAPN